MEYVTATFFPFKEALFMPVSDMSIFICLWIAVAICTWRPQEYMSPPIPLPAGQCVIAISSSV